MSTAERPPSGAGRTLQALAMGDPQVGMPKAIWGMALFLAAEVAIFGTLLASYFYLDTTDKAWPPDHIKAPAVLFPLLLTGFLLTTAIPANYAARAARRGERTRTLWALSVALLMQCGYLFCQILLYIQNIHQFSAQGSAYGSIYYTMLMFHHAHVAFGLALDLAIGAQVMVKGLTRYWTMAVRCLALYWYVVAALAIPVVLTQLSPSL